MPGEKEDEGFDDNEAGDESSASSSLKGQIVGASRTFLAYFQARAQLFTLEAREASEQMGKRITFLAIGGGLLFLGYLLLLAGLIPLLADATGLSWKVIGLIAAAIHLIVGVIFVLIARKNYSEPTFEESQNELEKDREWLARNLPTSNAKKRR